MANMTVDNDIGLKAYIQRYLVETGNYEKISDELNKRLLQDGWLDDVRRMTTDEIVSSGTTKYTDILEKVESKAIQHVSDSTKEQILDQIRSFLNEIVNTE